MLASSDIRAAAIGALLASVLGCAGANRPHSPAPLPPAMSVEALDALYNDAIRRAAVFTPGDALPLAPLVPDRDGTVTVASWADCLGHGAPNTCGAYTVGSVTLKDDVWVVRADEVKRRCRAFKDDVVLKLDQLIGLPPHRKMMPADTLEWQFVTFTHVPAASVFRPCTDTRIDTDRCSGTTLPDALPGNAPPDYYKWFTKQALSSWQISATGEPPKGYPWTRLGYTYNWAPGAASRYGVSEYVIASGSKPVTVTVASIESASDYCKPE